MARSYWGPSLSADPLPLNESYRAQGATLMGTRTLPPLQSQNCVSKPSFDEFVTRLETEDPSLARRVSEETLRRAHSDIPSFAYRPQHTLDAIRSLGRRHETSPVSPTTTRQIEGKDHKTTESHDVDILRGEIE